MNVIEFYNRLRNSTVGLPLWENLNPAHVHMIVQAVNLLLAICHDNGVVGKNTEEKN